MEFVELKGGLTLPTDVLEFALKLEDRGIVLEAAGEVLRVKEKTGSKPVLSDEESAFIRSRKAHLMAVAAYQAPGV
jgi:hypothetical protein